MQREPTLAIVLGVVVSLVSVFPLGALAALLVGIPAPVTGGVARGLDAASDSPFAILFYGASGGFLMVAALGVIGSWTALKIGGNNIQKSRKLNIVIPICLTALAVFGVSLWARIVE